MDFQALDMIGRQHLLAGADQVAQQFVIELLTERGSMRWLPLRGCSFLRLLRRSRTEHDVFAAWAASRNRIRNNLRTRQAVRRPSECFADATLEQLTIDPAGDLLLTFRVRLADGQEQDITTPPIRVTDYGSELPTAAGRPAALTDLAADPP
jgi:hypothetical protein